MTHDRLHLAPLHKLLPVAACLLLAACSPASPPAGAAAKAAEPVPAPAPLVTFPDALAAHRVLTRVPEPASTWLPPASDARGPVLRSLPLPAVMVRASGSTETPELAWRTSTPPATLPVEPLAQVQMPNPAHLATALVGSNPEPAPAATSTWLPFARTADAPRPLPGDATHPVPRRPATDLPVLADRPVASALSQAALPVDPPASALAPDPARAPTRLADYRAAPDRPNAATDPARVPAARIALAKEPESRANPVPFIPLVIPDPFEVHNAIDLHRPPPDSEPPLAAPHPRPTL